MAAFLADVELRAFKLAEYGVGNPDDAADIVQDAMLKLVDQYRARPATEWAPLFYRILEHRIQDHHRRRTVRQRVLTFLGFSAVDDEDATPPLEKFPDTLEPIPELKLATEQAHAAVRAALKALPLRQQQVVLLRDWEGLDVRETAVAMACSEGSVKTHYFRAIAALRARLAQNDAAES